MEEATGPELAPWHLITCEYPPDRAGVGDHTYRLAGGLAAAGDEVHVWCPGREGDAASDGDGDAGGVTVHRTLGRFRPRDLWATGRALDAIPGPRRLLVQWVPHGYGYRSLNLPFCLWVLARSRLRGDPVELVVHEPFLPFRPGALRQCAAAAVHRLMILVLLLAPRRVWITVPAWEARLRPYALRRRLPMLWLPAVCTIPCHDDPHRVRTLRATLLRGRAGLVGHFSTYAASAREALAAIVPALVRPEGGPAVLLLGRDGETFARDLCRRHPELASAVTAPGLLSPEELSLHLQTVDLLCQPYPDGVSSRRSTAMTSLAHGVPVVTTWGELSEPLWRESGAVHLVPAGDAPSLTQAVTDTLADPAACRRLADAGQALYRRRFALPRVVDRLRAECASG